MQKSSAIHFFANFTELSRAECVKTCRLWNRESFFVVMMSKQIRFFFFVFDNRRVTANVTMFCCILALRILIFRWFFENRKKKWNLLLRIYLNFRLGKLISSFGHLFNVTWLVDVHLNTEYVLWQLITSNLVWPSPNKWKYINHGMKYFSWKGKNFQQFASMKWITKTKCFRLIAMWMYSNDDENVAITMNRIFGVIW